MVWIVGGEQNTVSGFGQCADFIHDLALIAKVEACGRLVEHNEPGLLRQGARKQNQLSFSAGNHRVRARGKRRDTKAFERGLGDSVIFRTRLAEQTAMCCTAHQNDGFNSECEGADVHLRNVCDDSRPLSDRVVIERLVVEPHLAGFWFEKTKQSLQERSFAATVWPKQSKDFAGCESDIESAADGTVLITDGEIVAFDIHDQVLCMLARSQMKNGVPTTAVKMPSGISTSAAVRASVSMSSR